MPDKLRPRRHASGAADRRAAPVIDPTENVIALTEAANKRQDDLRAMAREMTDRDFAHGREMAALRADHQREMGVKESARTDSIRQVDREDVSKAAVSAQQAIATLALSTTTGADALRAQQEAKAMAAETRQMAFASEMGKRISAVELSLSEGKGKQAVADPMMAELVAEMRTLTAQRAAESGKTAVTDPALVQLAREVRELVTARASEGGRAAVADPALVALLAEVHSNSAALAATAGKREGISDSAKATVGAVMFLIAVLGFLASRQPTAPVPDPAIADLVSEVKALREARTPAAPSVIYVPAGTPMLPTTPATPPSGSR